MWLSPDWSLERTIQMDSRIYRQGQTKKVFIHSIIARNTIDQVVVDALSRKEQGQAALVDALKTYIKRRG